MLVFCPLELEGISPLLRYHEYSLGVIKEFGKHVNVTLFNASTVALAGLTKTPVLIKNISCMQSG